MPWERSLYFAGHDITLPIVVLGIYVLVGAVVVRMLWWRGDTRSTGGRQADDEELAIAAIPPPDGPRGGGVRCRWPVTTALVGGGRSAQPRAPALPPRFVSADIRPPGPTISSSLLAPASS